MLPSLSTISKSACCAGSSGFTVRPSSHGLGGFVAAIGFRTGQLSSRFAKKWAQNLPKECGGVFVRRSSGLWWVSVPVLPASVPVPARGGAVLSVVGSPPACRQAVSGGGVWAC